MHRCNKSHLHEKQTISVILHKLSKGRALQLDFLHSTIFSCNYELSYLLSGKAYKYAHFTCTVCLPNLAMLHPARHEGFLSQEKITGKLEN